MLVFIVISFVFGIAGAILATLIGIIPTSLLPTSTPQWVLGLIMGLMVSSAFAILAIKSFLASGRQDGKFLIWLVVIWGSYAIVTLTGFGLLTETVLMADSTHWAMNPTSGFLAGTVIYLPICLLERAPRNP